MDYYNVLLMDLFGLQTQHLLMDLFAETYLKTYRSFKQVKIIEI